MPFAEYLALPGLSNSQAAVLLGKTPAHLRAHEWGEQSSAMRVGTAVHMLVLEPEKVAAMLPVAPVVDRRTTAGKAAWARFTGEMKPGALVLNADERRLADGAAIAVLTNRQLAESGLLRGRRELTILFDLDGCPAKARLDVFANAGIAVDLKTSRNAWEFHRSVPKLSYHRQAAFYLRAAAAAGLEPKAFLFVVVETSDEMMRSENKAEFVRVIKLDDVAVHHGELEILRAAKTYRQCLDSGEWPGYSGRGIETVSLPMWALTEE